MCMLSVKNNSVPCSPKSWLKKLSSCKTGIIISGVFCYVDDILLTSTTVTRLQKSDRHSCVTISQTDLTFQKQTACCVSYCMSYLQSSTKPS